MGSSVWDGHHGVLSMSTNCSDELELWLELFFHGYQNVKVRVYLPIERVRGSLGSLSSPVMARSVGTYLTSQVWPALLQRCPPLSVEPPSNQGSSQARCRV